MEIIKGYPPNINDIMGKFRTTLDVVFTYGDILYNPSGAEIGKPLMAHEETHSRQQKFYGVDTWWKKYLEDQKFRLEQEVEAYANQHKQYCKNNKKIVSRIMFLNHLASDLSSSLYGNIISFEEAINLIKFYETH